VRRRSSVSGAADFYKSHMAAEENSKTAVEKSPPSKAELISFQPTIRRSNTSTATSDAGPVSQSEALGAIREVKRLKVALVDKEKHITNLERALVAAESSLAELQKQGSKYKSLSKNLSREAKRLQFSQEVLARRQNLEINRISSQLEKQENKIRRKKLERQELFEELERIEDFYELQASQFNEEMIAMREEAAHAMQEANERAAALEQELQSLKSRKPKEEVRGVGGAALDSSDMAALKAALNEAVSENQRFRLLLDQGEMYLDIEAPNKGADAATQEQISILEKQAKDCQAVIESLQLAAMESQAKIERLEAAEQQNQALIHRFELYVQESQSEILMLELTSKDSAAQVQRLESSVEDYQAEIKAMENLIEESQAKIDKLTIALNDSKYELQQMVLQGRSNVEELARLRSELSEKSESNQISSKPITELTPENSLPIITRLETSLKETQNELQALNVAYRAQELKIEHYASTAKEQSTKIQRLEYALKESQAEVQRLQLENDKNLTHISKLEIALETSKSQMAQTELALKTADRQLKVSDMATTACRAQIASLEAELAALNSEHVRLRFDMFSQTSALAASNAKFAAQNSKLNLQLKDLTGPPDGRGPDGRPMI
jgi:chromosome segregation ATPase